MNAQTAPLDIDNLHAGVRALEGFSPSPQQQGSGTSRHTDVTQRVALRAAANVVALSIAFAVFAMTNTAARWQLWVALLYLAVSAVVDYVKDDGCVSASCELVLALRSASLTLAIVVACTYFAGLPTSRIFLCVTVVAAPVVRGCLGRLLQRVERASALTRVLCIADADKTEELRLRLLEAGSRAATLVGEPELLFRLRESARLGSLPQEALKQHCRRLRVDVLAVDLPYLGAPEVQQALGTLQTQGVRIRMFAVLFEELLGRVHARSLASSWFLLFDLRSTHHRGYRLVRVAIDRTGGAVAFLVLAVVGPPVALLIGLTMGRPIFFRQRRVGEHGKEFEIVKFRTMLNEPDRLGPQFDECDLRVTALGRFLRRSRIDELPQAWNILRGQMSLIGPRPEWRELANIYRHEIPLYDLRHAVKPGVTGWAQIRQGHGASIGHATAKLEYDLYYVRYQSLALDLRILWHTLRILAFGRGR